MNEIINNFKKVFLASFANFDGRARRSEFWLFHLVLQLLYFVLMIPLIFLVAMVMIATLNTVTEMSGIYIGVFVLLGIFIIALMIVLIPVLAVTARRLHDTNRSGWWMLLGFIPFGSIVVLYFLVLAGDENENEYGFDPKEEERNYYRNLASQQPSTPGHQGYVQNY